MSTEQATGVMADSVCVRVMTYVDEEMECTLGTEEWVAYRSRSPTLYGCTSCELLTESTRPYPGAWRNCPSCDTRMAEVKYMIRE